MLQADADMFFLRIKIWTAAFGRTRRVTRSLGKNGANVN